MRSTKHKTWNRVKGAIIREFGSISACASYLDCSADGIRKAVDGRCPGIARDLKSALNFDWDAEEVTA